MLELLDRRQGCRQRVAPAAAAYLGAQAAGGVQPVVSQLGHRQRLDGAAEEGAAARRNAHLTKARKMCPSRGAGVPPWVSCSSTHSAALRSPTHPTPSPPQRAKTHSAPTCGLGTRCQCQAHSRPSCRSWCDYQERCGRPNCRGLQGFGRAPERGLAGRAAAQQTHCPVEMPAPKGPGPSMGRLYRRKLEPGLGTPHLQCHCCSRPCPGQGPQSRGCQGESIGCGGRSVGGAAPAEQGARAWACLGHGRQIGRAQVLGSRSRAGIGTYRVQRRCRELV